MSTDPNTLTTDMDDLADKTIADMAELIGVGVTENLTSMDIAGNCWICVLHRLSEAGLIT